MNTRIWDKLGLNIGNDIIEGVEFNAAQALADAAYHKAIGLKYIRIPGSAFYINNPSEWANAQRANMRTMAVNYLNQGIEVLYIASWYGTFTTDSVSAYETHLAEEAAWAQSVGIQRLQIMNEMEINIDGSFTQASLYTYMQTLPAVAAAAGFTGDITASVSQDWFSQWTANGVGNYDSLGLDIYGSGAQESYGLGNYANFCSQIETLKAAIGDDLFISEFACSGQEGDLSQIDPVVYTREIMKRANYLEANFTVPCYLFTWRMSTDRWSAMRSGSTLRRFWYDMIAPVGVFPTAYN